MPKLVPQKRPAKPAPKPAPAAAKPASKPTPAKPTPAAAAPVPAPVDMGALLAMLAANGVQLPQGPAIAAPVPAAAKPAARSPGRPAAGPRPTMPAPSAAIVPTPAGPSAETVQLRSELASVRAELAKLSKAAARSKGPQARTEAEILDGAPELGPDDWRAGYHGRHRFTLGWERADNGWGKPHAPIALTGGPSTYALLAIPRDSDGPHGAACRAAGLLAVYETTTEAGEWLPPVYVTEAELGSIWDHEANEANAAAGTED